MTYNQKTVLNILVQIESQNIDDPRFSDQQDDLVDLLTENQAEAMNIIESLSENQLALITPLFEEISFTFQNQKFIDCIVRLAEKYPDIAGIEDDVLVAKSIVEG